MKYFREMLTNKTAIILAFSTLIAIFLHVRAIEFPCFNSDEASFAYNTYSIGETGKDEYGKLLPLRFQAFGENKLPVTIYLMVPFIKVFGLNETASRLPFILIGILSPLLFYMLTKKLTQNEWISLLVAFLASISPWIQIMSRHIHENLIVLVLTIGILWFLHELLQKVTLRSLIILAMLVGVGLFTYHVGKVLAVFTFIWIGGIVTFKKPNRVWLKKTLLLGLVPLLLFGLSELLQPSSRISNLLFTSNQGFTLSIEELRREHDDRFLHNKVTRATIILAHQYLSYFSPEFLVRYGDANDRFGFEGISPITAIEYVFLLMGIYFAFVRKERGRYLMLSLFLVAPSTASLSWQEHSLTRSFLMIIPILYFAGCGMYFAGIAISSRILRVLFYSFVLGGVLFFTFFTWDFYFNHYRVKPQVASAWQCGYGELGSYLKKHEDDYDRIYITKKLGQPYIFSLFYTQYPPAEYQKEAQLSSPDEYGFGQVERYGKYVFAFTKPDPNESALFVGYPEEFGEDAPTDRIEKIQINGKDVFWIYAGRKNK